MYGDLREKLARAVPELTVRSFSYLGEGEDNVAFEVNGGLIVRFTKRDEEAVEREAAILDFVRAVSPLPTPVLRYSRPDSGFLAYEKLPGLPMIKSARRVDLAQWPDLAAQLGGFLSIVNNADIEPIRSHLLTDADSLESWRADTRADFTQVEHLIPRPYRASVESFLDLPAPDGQFEPTFTHNDLGIEHILIDPAARQITGIIDWGDTALADPAYDFGKIYRDLGPDVFQAALRAYSARPDAGLTARAVFYARCGVVEDLVYGVERESGEYVEKCLAALPWLFDAIEG